MSSLLDRLKVKNLPEKKKEYKILIPRKTQQAVKPRTSIPKLKNPDAKDGDGDGDEGDDIFKPKKQSGKVEEKKQAAIVDMTDNDTDFSDFFNKAKGLIFVNNQVAQQTVDTDIEEINEEAEEKKPDDDKEAVVDDKEVENEGEEEKGEEEKVKEKKGEEEEEKGEEGEGKKEKGKGMEVEKEEEKEEGEGLEKTVITSIDKADNSSYYTDLRMESVFPAPNP